MNGSPEPAVKRIAFWLAPLAFCLWVHWYGIKSWFHSDDFAWLGLHRQVYDLASLVRILFEPAAQGTIRPWSERGFFLLFHYFFGMDALPYRIWVFLTQFANLLLLTWIVRKVSGSRWAALRASILWTANAALAIPMAWSSDYNQILCGFFLLAAFALYLSGRYWLQFAVFVLGFGALEVNVVYPAILIAWLWTQRQSIKPALPLAAVSAAYYALHFALVRSQTSGPYALHWDASIFHTLWTYWSWTFVPQAWSVMPGHSDWGVFIAIAIGTLAVAYFTLRDRSRLALFFLFWFLITVAPVLPLRDHLSDYYATLPSLGIAVILALALTQRPVFAGVAVAAYLFVQTPSARAISRWYYGRGREVRTLVMGVKAAHDRHPRQSLLLSGISPDLYNMSLAHSPFYALGVDNVYLTPDMPTTGIEDATLLPQYILTGEPLLRALAEEKIQVYAPDAGRLRNITSSYEATAMIKIVPETPRRVDVAVPVMAYLLGSTWYPPDGNFRWMPQAATVRIGAPRTPDARLVLTGYCPQEQTRLGPLKLFLSVNGQKISETEFNKPETQFSRTFLLPPEAVGKGSIELGLRLSRTFQYEAGGPPRGLIFGVFEVR